MKFKTLAVLNLILATNLWAADPLFDQQWGLSNTGQKVFRAEDDIRREEVKGIKGMDVDWPGHVELSKLGQGREVIVAVIDSGIDLTHPDLAGRLYTGKDFLDNAKMVDDTGHGTHVSGIIAANLDGSGIEGLTPKSIKILPLKVLNKDTTSFVYKGRVITDVIADAIAYAIDANVAVINMSLGWPQLINTPRIVKSLDHAAQKGIVLVAASGNNNKDVPTWPCSHPAVICVGAIDNQGGLTEFSNHGGKVDLVAPGEWIVSTIPRALESRTLRIQGFEAKNGSSQAAPFVAAAAALLRLKNPEMTVEEIKARLYASAKKVKADKDHRFVRFGMLSIKGALALENAAVSSVVVKELVTVDVDEAGKYKFSLPLEILGKNLAVPQVSVQGLEVRVQVEGPVVNFSGVITDLNADSEVPVKFKTRHGSVVTETSVTLSFARKLKVSELSSTKIPAIPSKYLMSIQGGRKLSRMGQVSVEGKALSDFHGFVQAKTGDKIQVISIRANAGSRAAETSTVILEGHAQLLAVFEKDVNFDGRSDLIFYGMNAAKDHLTLTFTDLAGKPLFGRSSVWELPISTFEGLPIKEGERADFSWIKVKTFLGDLAVPYYLKTWTMPKEDNSTSLLDHEPEGMDQRLYYLEPYVEGDRTLIRPRVTDSVAFKKVLNKTLKAGAWDRVNIERLLPQSMEERSSGSARHLVSKGDGFNRVFFILKMNRVGEHTIAPHADPDVFQAGNNALQTRMLEDFSVSKNSFQMALLDRSSSRVKPFIEGSATPAWNLKTSGWSNPFFEVVATFEGVGRRVLFFESRYHVYVYEQGAEELPVGRRLPINRDSSFPGVDFSETLQSVLVRNGAENDPAVAVNSTLIYGDRLYTMVSSADAFTRPIALSVKIPANCVPTKSQLLRSESYSAYALLCQNADDSVDLGFFPLMMK
ncbi:MAG TPA: S8 family serine peptidase [Bacteriovoracaceae bacterium]|nr:S8 family serine peptidase [Bacteriovoracaceae bacterium]